MEVKYYTFLKITPVSAANFSIWLPWKRPIAFIAHAWQREGRVSNQNGTKAVRLLEKQLHLMKSEKQADHCDQWIHDRLHFSTHCKWFSNILSTPLNWNLTRRPKLNVKGLDAETQATLSTWLSISWRHTKANLQLSLSHDPERVGQWYNPNNLES